MKVYRRIIGLILFAFLGSNAWGQNIAKTYIRHGNSRGTIPCYNVTIIEINYDSTYLRTDYGCGNNNTWRNYKEWKAETSIGKIEKLDDYYRMTEYRDNRPTLTEFELKITERKIIFWYEREDSKRKFKGMKLKKASL